MIDRWLVRICAVIVVMAFAAPVGRALPDGSDAGDGRRVALGLPVLHSGMVSGPGVVLRVWGHEWGYQVSGAAMFDSSFACGYRQAYASMQLMRLLGGGDLAPLSVGTRAYVLASIGHGHRAGLCSTTYGGRSFEEGVSLGFGTEFSLPWQLTVIVDVGFRGDWGSDEMWEYGERLESLSIQLAPQLSLLYRLERKKGARN